MRIPSRAVPPLAVDALIAAAQTVVAVLLGLEAADQWQQPLDLLGYVLVGLANLPTAARSKAPLAVCLLIHATWIAYISLGYWPVVNSLGPMVLVYTVAVLRPLRTAVACAVLMGATWIYAGVLADTDSMASVVAQAIAFPAVLCRFGVGARRVAELAEQLREEQEERARREVAEERGRIARELHDVVAHHMSVISIQTGLARFVFDSDPPTARAALGTISATGQEALEELRRMLRVLRAQDDDGEPTAPMPGLARLEELAERVRTGGVPVEVRVIGEQRPLAPGVDLCAYRVVQEALTNVLKHAGPARAAVEVRYLPDRLTVTVTDDGRGATRGPVPATVRGTGGHGLIGMRERAKLYGGTISMGPREGGGFTVHLTLPTSARAPARGDDSTG